MIAQRPARRTSAGAGLCPGGQPTAVGQRGHDRIADVRVLSTALTALLRAGRTDLVDAYSDTCLRRVWRAEHFSWWMTSMLHQAPGADDFARELQLSQLRYTAASTAAATSLAENYVGLPWAATG